MSWRDFWKHLDAKAEPSIRAHLEAHGWNLLKHGAVWSAQSKDGLSFIQTCSPQELLELVDKSDERRRDS